MISSPTFSILIWINSSRAKNNQAELYARITVNSKRANISLKKKIDINSWDNTKSRVRGNTQDARIINQYIEQTKAAIFQVYQELKTESRLLTSQLIKARFFFMPFHLLILIWNSKSFELSKLKRFLFVVLNLSLFYGTLLFLIYYSNL